MLAPLLAMQVTDEVAWDVADFAVLGALLLAVGFTYGLAARMSSNVAYRVALGGALAVGGVLVWVNGAVGLFGS